MFRKLWLSILGAVAVTISLSGCTNYPSFEQLPFDSGDSTINSLAAEMEPQFNGRYIVFTSDRRGRQGIYVYDVIQKLLIDVPGLNGFEPINSHPSISQDGRYIVFATVRQGKSAIALYDRQTSQIRNITANLPGYVRNPTISADGNTIAFESSRKGQWDILVSNRFGQPLDVPTDPR